MYICIFSMYLLASAFCAFYNEWGLCGAVLTRANRKHFNVGRAIHTR